MEKTRHVSVMVKEVLEYLQANTPGLYLDGTYGGGGHSRAILGAHPDNSVIALDRDPDAVGRASALTTDEQARLEVHQSPFSKFSSFLRGQKLDGAFVDLGMSTDQLYAGRGFSFSDSDSLDMRMNSESGISAAELVNSFDERELRKVFLDGGVGADSSRAAKVIVEHRPFADAESLAQVLKRSLTKRDQRKASHPATVIFQALRIFVNREMEEISEFLAALPASMKPGGRLVVLCFHSLEDKVVTRALRKMKGEGRPALLGGGSSSDSLGRLLTPKAVQPDEHEVRANPASRSARLRAFEFFV